MKTLRFIAILISLILLNEEVVFAQSSCGYFFNYQSNTGWKSVEKGNNSHPRGNITISNGQLHFNDVSNGQYDTRYYYELDSALCNSWRTSFDFNFINHSGHSSEKFSHFIFALTEDTLAPAYIQNPGTGPNIIKTDHDGIFIRFGNNISNGWHFEVYTKVGLNYTTHCQLTVPQITDVVYNIDLMRIDAENGRIRITSNELSSPLQCCFSIPSSLGPLKVLQHANKPDASFRRSLTASFSSLCIEDCYQKQLCCALDPIENHHLQWNTSIDTMTVNEKTFFNILSFTPKVALPSGYSQSWEIYYAENCASGDVNISSSHPNAIRPATFGNPGTFYSSSNSNPPLYIDSCYVILHTIIGNNGECIYPYSNKITSNILDHIDSIFFNPGGFDCKDHFVFPNPYVESFTVRVPHRNKDYTFRLYDIAGRLIKEGDLSRRNSQFEFSDISAASYFLLIFDKGELVCRQRIVRVWNE